MKIKPRRSAKPAPKHREGAMVPVVLTFENAGQIEIMLPVLPAGSKSMDHSAKTH